jgi:hypothetical protein
MPHGLGKEQRMKFPWKYIGGALLATSLSLPAAAQTTEARELAQTICKDQTGSAFAACVRQQERSFNCSSLANPQPCEARKQASRECAGLVGWSFRQCTEQKLDQQDCSRTSDPQRCQLNKQAAAACRDKAGADHMTCLRAQFSAQ